MNYDPSAIRQLPDLPELMSFLIDLRLYRLERGDARNAIALKGIYFPPPPSPRTGPRRIRQINTAMLYDVTIHEDRRYLLQVDAPDWNEAAEGARLAHTKTPGKPIAQDFDIVRIEAAE